MSPWRQLPDDRCWRISGTSTPTADSDSYRRLGRSALSQPFCVRSFCLAKCNGWLNSHAVNLAHGVLGSQGAGHNGDGRHRGSPPVAGIVAMTCNRVSLRSGERRPLAVRLHAIAALHVKVTWMASGTLNTEVVGAAELALDLGKNLLRLSLGRDRPAPKTSPVSGMDRRDLCHNGLVPTRPRGARVARRWTQRGRTSSGVASRGGDRRDDMQPRVTALRRTPL